MKKSSIIIHSIFILIIIAGSSVSYAGQRTNVFEMADGNIITFPTTPEEKALLEVAKVESRWLKPARFAGPAKRDLVIEMAESGITVSFKLTEKETTTRVVKDSERVVPHSARSYRPGPQVVTIELSESGNYIIFPAARGEIDQKNPHQYSHNRP